MAMKPYTTASDTITRGRCFSVYLLRSKCHTSQWPTEAKSLSGVPRKSCAGQDRDRRSAQTARVRIRVADTWHVLWDPPQRCQPRPKNPKQGTLYKKAAVGLSCHLAMSASVTGCHAVSSTSLHRARSNARCCS
jgi:hypothetical protein